MAESMSATDAIRSVAKSLNDAAMMLAYIADSLDHEFALAADRGRKLAASEGRPNPYPVKELGGLDDWNW